MIKYLVIDSEYCSMGRWISLIVANKMGMKLYEAKDLLELIDEPWLTIEYLQNFDASLANMSEEEAKQSDELKKVHLAISKAIEIAIKKGPCIIHERAAGDILRGKVNYLKVLLYNTNVEHKIPRAIADKTYNLTQMATSQIISFIEKEDLKRSHYCNGVSTQRWGQKESYDLCLDSDILSREKCAEILIEALKEVTLDLNECENIIKNAFTWTK